MPKKVQVGQTLHFRHVATGRIRSGRVTAVTDQNTISVRIGTTTVPVTRGASTTTRGTIFSG